MVQFISKMWKVLPYSLLLYSGQFIFAMYLIFFKWPNQIGEELIGLFLLLYFVALVLLTIIQIAKKQLNAILQSLAAIGILLGSIYVGIPKILSELGFYLYISPEGKYIKNHCDPVQFSENENANYVGICNYNTIDFYDSQTYELIVYDTSGEILKNSIGKNPSLGKAPREWVNAIREIYGYKKGTGFELLNFHTNKIINNFYLVDFYSSDFNNLDENGFTKQYGPPHDATNKQ